MCNMAQLAHADDDFGVFVIEDNAAMQDFLKRGLSDAGPLGSHHRG